MHPLKTPRTRLRSNRNLKHLRILLIDVNCISTCVHRFMQPEMNDTQEASSAD